MEVEYSLTIQDLQALTRYHRRSGYRLRPHFSATKIIAFVIFSVLLAVFVQLGPLFLPPVDLSRMGPFWLGLFVGFMVMILLQFWQGRIVIQTVRRLYDNEEARWILAPKRMRINANGVSITSEFHHLTNSWAVICGLGVTEDHAFFFTTRIQAHVVPRRAFRDPKEFKAFVDQARDYLDGWDQQGPRSDKILDALPAQPTGITRPHHP